MVSEDIQISLKKTIPNWVAETNSDDDRDIKNDPLEQEKTFGFSSLIQGIAEAYKQRTGSQEYFDLKIPVTTK